jgi:response regulator NasT
MTAPLRIVVVASDPSLSPADDDVMRAQMERSHALRIGLLENNFNLIATLPPDAFLAERIAQLQPDLVILDAESDARDALEHVVMVTRDAPRPIVMFTNDEDTSRVRDALAAGVSAYIVAGLEPQRIRPILDVAMARFQQQQALLNQLAQTRSELDVSKAELANRKVIDRAKGLLMQRHNITEQQAYERLRGAAMDKGMKLVEVAQRMLDVADLLG